MLQRNHYIVSHQYMHVKLTCKYEIWLIPARIIQCLNKILTQYYSQSKLSSCIPISHKSSFPWIQTTYVCCWHIYSHLIGWNAVILEKNLLYFILLHANCVFLQFTYQIWYDKFLWLKYVASSWAACWDIHSVDTVCMHILPQIMHEQSCTYEYCLSLGWLPKMWTSKFNLKYNSFHM